MATRTQAREMVVELLYAYTMGNERIFDFVDELLRAKKIRNAQADFAKDLLNGVMVHLQNIDNIIATNLKSWEIKRLGVIDKCILRLGVYEILNGKIDAPIVINEAIEIAKILGAEHTGKFVNGVLDAINKGNFDLINGVEITLNSNESILVSNVKQTNQKKNINLNKSHTTNRINQKNAKPKKYTNSANKDAIYVNKNRTNLKNKPTTKPKNHIKRTNIKGANLKSKGNKW